MPNIGVEYQVHQEGSGWSEWFKNGAMAGVIGKSLRVEAIRWRLINVPDGEEVFLHGQGHLENIGWSGFVAENTICGTVGESRKLEAIQFQLVGKDAEKYSIQFRSHSQDLGTQDWARDGELSGSEGAGLRIEAVQLIITDNGVDLGLYDIPSFRHFDPIPVPEPQPPTPTGYFGPDEFKCECGCGGDVGQEIKDLANRVRELYGYPLIISSGFRCYDQNERDGGIPGSNHTLGYAADMYSPGRMSYDEVDRLAECIVACGGGVIKYHEQLFCHMELSDANWSMN